jgi:hypothetical protein
VNIFIVIIQLHKFGYTHAYYTALCNVYNMYIVLRLQKSLFAVTISAKLRLVLTFVCCVCVVCPIFSFNPFITENFKTLFAMKYTKSPPEKLYYRPTEFQCIVHNINICLHCA